MPPASAVSRLRGSGDSDARDLASRVCDSCIRRKIKCDLGRPKCSRCSERGYTCTYSLSRRRPGPPPGTKRGSQRATTGTSTSSHPQESPRTLFLSPVNSPSGFVTPAPQLCPPGTTPTPDGGVPAGPASAAAGGSGVSHDSSAAKDYLGPTDILPAEEERLLKEYWDNIHDSIPVFSRRPSPLDRGASPYSRDVVLTLLIITAKLTGFAFASNNVNVDAHIDMALSSTSLQEDMFGDSPSLDQFRKSCLLAFYEFHQFPGQQAWMRIGKLTRMAYWMGLDRLDLLHSHSPDWQAVAEDHLEDWRLLWWCVYRLDSYANISAGMPFQVDEAHVNTALMRHRSQHGGYDAEPKISLPYHPDGLLDLLPGIVSAGSPQASSFNLHIITVTALRHAAREIRLRGVKPKAEIFAALSDAACRLSALRLALPKNYLNPMRNAFSNESGADHHARLVTVLHLHMARLLIAVASCSRWPEGRDWLLSWQQVLEVCQDAAAIAEQWNSAFSLRVDPAISFIIFTALTFLDLHKKFAGVAGSAGLQSEIEHCETVLLLQLEQFGNFWTLPKLLILSFKSFRELVKGPLSYRHITYVLGRFEAPVHPRWLKFLSSAHVDLQTC